jgi:hypothetical protein
MAVLGIVQGVDVVVRSAPIVLKEQLRRLATTPPQNASARDPAIRAMLRWGGFKPSGRNRPAQEYLSNIARSQAGLIEEYASLLSEYAGAKTTDKIVVSVRISDQLRP